MWLAALWVLLGSVLLVEGASRTRSMERIVLSGREYLRVRDWAAAQGLQVAWIKRDESLQLTRGSRRVVLTVNSCLVWVDRVQVWLSYPPLSRNAGVYISRLDAEGTIEPILSPPRNSKGQKVAVVCLDPGHGGKDPGNRVGGHEEKKYTLLLAQEIRRQLVARGLKVVLTRTNDRFVDLSERTQYARRQGADLFVSLHFNSTALNRNLVRGSEVFCLTPAGARSTNAGQQVGGAKPSNGNRYNDESVALAYAVQKQLVQSVKFEDRGVRRARFAVLRDAEMPAVLVEAGFMSNPSEGRRIFGAESREGIARAVVEGIMSYKLQTGERKS